MKKIGLVCIVLLALILPVSATDNIVSIGNYLVDSGENIRVPIYLNNSVNAAGGAFTMNFDPAVMEAYSLAPADKGDLDFYQTENSLNGTGQILITSTIALGSETPITGNVTLGYVRLHAIGPQGSSSALALNIVSFTDPAGNDVAATHVDGLFSIKGQIPDSKINIIFTPPAKVGNSTKDILKVEYVNFSNGDPYSVSITDPDGNVTIPASGTLSGLGIEIIPIDWTPLKTGTHTVNASGKGMKAGLKAEIYETLPIKPVPEIATIIMVSAGILGLVGISRRKKE